MQHFSSHRDKLLNNVFQTDLMVVASDLPGMDFVTMSIIHEHHVSRSFWLYGPESRIYP